jgi:histidinol-phosphate aminotransferase
MRVIAPYPVPLPVSELAIKALSDNGISQMRQQVAQLKHQGERLSQTLVNIGANVISAHGNFVLARFDDVASIAKALTDNGIVARAYKDPRLADAIRFSFTSQVQTDKIIEVLLSSK